MMRVTLDKEKEFITNDGKVDLKSAFRYSGIKAAWCYKKGTATPETIREMSEENLIRMGMNTWVDDHGTPDEHFSISVEVTGIPKILCMIINAERQYVTCERSLRYTIIKPGEGISDLEIEKYTKWYNIYVNIFESQYKDWFLKINNNDEEKAKIDMGKKAQELARNFVSVNVPTSIAYTAPWYQWQKIATMLMDMAKNPKNDLAKLAAPSAIEFVRQLIEKRVVVKAKDAIEIYPPIKEKIKDDREWLFRENKGIELRFFAKNPFSGIDKPNDFGASINYNTTMSVSASAQCIRSRTAYMEMALLDYYDFDIPPFIIGTNYEKELIKDMMELEGLYPQGQKIKLNIISSLQNIILYMGQERACERAQQEIEDWYITQFLEDIAEGLKKRPEYREQYELIKNSYLNRCRCAYPTYHCPSPCGHPRVKRPF